ncbi:YgaP family membrane protein [Flavobacterium sp. PLA-1-15]|uniref:YgaP family membrane protein n=1 Tax=Flavobacterium sp. PLA-1-15 TaxID=3380533 RepID=UPI003B7BEAC4
MRRNVNRSGSILRAIIGIVSITLSFTIFFEDEIVNYGLFAIGAVLIVAALIQICPFYYFLGLNDNKTKKMKMY